METQKEEDEVGRQEKSWEISRQSGGNTGKKWCLSFPTEKNGTDTNTVNKAVDRMEQLEKNEMNKEWKNSIEED